MKIKPEEKLRKIKPGPGRRAKLRSSLPCSRWLLDLVPVSSLGLRCQIQPELIHPLLVRNATFQPVM